MILTPKFHSIRKDDIIRHPVCIGELSENKGTGDRGSVSCCPFPPLGTFYVGRE